MLSLANLCQELKNLSEISQRTALYDEHVALGARMVPFAGYDIPVQHPMGIFNAHKLTRQTAGLFAG